MRVLMLIAAIVACDVSAYPVVISHPSMARSYSVVSKPTVAAVHEKQVVTKPSKTAPITIVPPITIIPTTEHCGGPQHKPCH